jgi:hypothetical protein
MELGLKIIFRLSLYHMCAGKYISNFEYVSLTHKAMKYLFCLFLFFGMVSLYSLGCLGTHSVDQAGLELRNLLVFASQVLGLKACATTA